MATEPRTHVTELQIEQLAAGEKSTLSNDDPAIRARLDSLTTSNEAILRAYPPEQFRKQIERKLQKRRQRVVWAVSTVAAMAFIFGLSPLLLPTEPSERTKGLAPHVVVWRKAEAPQPLAEGAVVARGDLLQLGYVGAGARFGVIVSLDGRGQTTLHFPLSREASTRLSSDSGTVLLDSAYELDDAPSFERFFFVTSDEPLDVAAVVEAVRRLTEARDGGRVGMPVTRGKTRVGTLMLEKEGR